MRYVAHFALLVPISMILAWVYGAAVNRWANNALLHSSVLCALSYLLSFTLYPPLLVDTQAMQLFPLLGRLGILSALLALIVMLPILIPILLFAALEDSPNLSDDFSVLHAYLPFGWYLSSSFDGVILNFYSELLPVLILGGVQFALTGALLATGASFLPGDALGRVSSLGTSAAGILKSSNWVPGIAVAVITWAIAKLLESWLVGMYQEMARKGGQTSDTHAWYFEGGGYFGAATKIDAYVHEHGRGSWGALVGRRIWTHRLLAWLVLIPALLAATRAIVGYPWSDSRTAGIGIVISVVFLLSAIYSDA